MGFEICNLGFGIWDFADCILTEKFYIFFEEKGIYLGDDFVKPIFDYLLNNGSIVDTLELLYTS